MDINLHATFLPHDDPEAAVAFYRDVLGFEVRNDVGYGDKRWITVGPAGQPGVNIVLNPLGADPGVTEEESRVIAEMMAKGTYASMVFATSDLDSAFEKIQAGNADVVSEPMMQSWGVRDCALRDPAGNMIRIQEIKN
ncbi:putative glyoxalase superfamily protein PhnB [Crossiella equi]|uniref:Glyoxalase superfamily protein PhnB n=1 Tax=Crossiella equi TaxID=130796 RepID=A0ABS5A8W8_9PSEU|nr:VOC family protein [Crossiella equi]MBP2473010.1 putative glyoxalase superfamily protein PhnB [Crossiella equi]